ncbi:T-complex 11 [Trypanosoma melophagium]|uniref:T-complex 11 n=1 Tax=Trypanosoma melophagium TaxID=715481 RepID=UPI00351A69A9|nr:T-complex 11 [Trypanosoma melophagium]
MAETSPSIPQKSPPSAAECVKQVSKFLRQFEASGLQYNPAHPLPPEAVEHILITDEWYCKSCGNTNLKMCPETGRPHRRHLVRVAQEILRRIGSKTGQIVVRPPNLTASMNGRSRLRSQRRITMNPHALLLSYYYAVLPSNEVDGIISECAQHLVELFEQLKVYGAQEVVDEQYAAALLSSIGTTWQEYSKKAAEDLCSLKGADRRACRSVLVMGTKEAYVAASRELRKTPANKDLQAFVVLLHDRLVRLTSQEDLNELEATMREAQREEEEEEDEKGNNTEREKDKEREGPVAQRTPANFQLATPPAPMLLLSEGNTSGSEAEPVLPVVMGPVLPPNWYVDEHGRSRPPTTDPLQIRREKYVQLEFRARKAYETVIKVPEPKKDPWKEQIVSSLNEAQLALLAEQCNRQPPDLQNIPRFLNLVIEGLLNSLPRRLRSQTEQELRDVLDWRIVRRSVMGSPGNIAALMRYVMGKVAEYGSSARAEKTRKLAEELAKNLETCTPDLGTAVANTFRVMLSSIRQLHEDIAQYSLLFITQQLRDNAVAYIREFISECHASVDQWESSLAFIRRYFNDTRVKEWANSPVAISPTTLTEEEKCLRGSLLYGLLDLLRSGGIQTADRWHDYPTECFYFEKSVVFFAANTVQESSLLLLLSGSISTVLRGKGIDSRVVNDILKQLHDKFIHLLSEQLTLPYLKTSVTSLIDDALTQRKASPALTESEINQIHGSVDKMTDTTGPLYLAFEKRVLSFIEAILAHGQTDPPPLGLVTDSLRRLASLLQHMLAFNWEVYQPFYKDMLRYVTDGGSAS